MFDFRPTWYRAIAISTVFVACGTAMIGCDAPATANRKAAPEPEPPPVDLTLAIARQAQRSKLVDIDGILDHGWLSVRPGMTVLDVGAGAGHFSFAIAARMNGKGRVFATEVLPDRMAHIQKEASKRGLEIVTPVLVDGSGLDAFYTEHRYDLVFMNNVYHRIDDHEPGSRRRYFRKLRKQLNDDGRLAIILYRHVPPVTASDFIDIDAAIRDLANDKEYDPFYWSMSEVARGQWDLLASEPGRVISPEQQSLFVEEINRAIAIPSLYRYFFGEKFFHPGLLDESQRDFANWLLLTLREEGTDTKGVDDLTAKEARAVRQLNSLFFVSRFRRHLAHGRVGSYIPRGDVNRQTSKFLVIKEVGEAGFAFAEEHVLSPYFTLLVFEPGTAHDRERK
jgi:SAM-dependent methyltransferase